MAVRLIGEWVDARGREREALRAHVLADTLRAAGLETFGEVILRSEAVLVTRSGADLPAGFEEELEALIDQEPQTPPALPPPLATPASDSPTTSGPPLSPDLQPGPLTVTHAGSHGPPQRSPGGA